MNIKIKKLDVSLRTVYAQAKELAHAQKAVPVLTAGSLQTEERAGGRFVYRYRYDAAGKRITEYVGATADAGTAEKVEQAKAEIRDHAAIAEYSQQLRRIGFYSADNSTVVTVASLFNAGVFGGGGVLVGTHAFGAILNELGVAASPFPMTEDVDVAARSVELAALPEGGFVELLKQTGLPFHEVPTLKRGAPSTSFKVRGRRLKVDLLVPARGKPYTSVKVPGLGAHAVGLPYLDYLLKATTGSVLIGRDRIIPVTVPHPGWFCLHKLALFELRTGADNPKREKDLFQAVLLASALAQDQDFLLVEAIEGADSKLRSKIKPGARRALALMKDGPREAIQLLEPLA
jgi:YD repeat-containing protein